MKKYILSIFAICSICLMSCRREDVINAGRHSSDNRMENICVGFGTETKCSESHGETFLGETAVVTETGDTLYISTYLSDMDHTSSSSDEETETKSTLIGSSNFGTAAGYTSFSLNVYKEGENSIYKSTDETQTKTPMENVNVSYIGGSTQYKWKFGDTYYWPTDNKALNFCSFGPSDEFGSSGSASNLTWNNSTHTFSFNYTTPSSSADSLDAQYQKDIIVGVNQQKFVKDGTNNISLELKHPLMAVRFVLGDLWGKIRYISLDNFYSVGTASVTKDNVVWSGLSTQQTFYQLFDMFDTTKYTDEQKAAGTVELDQTLDKSRNFIIIPQNLPANASLSLKMGNTLHEITLNFDKIVGDGLTKDWSGYAGKVLTFRISSLKANLVSVDITDVVSGSKKDNIKIFNDGKSDLYVRAVLVGNWLNSKGNILAAWDEELPYGTFDGKNPVTDATAFPRTLPSNWVLHSDGFYYYKKILPSGYRVSQNLFDEFILTDKPSVENTEDPDVQLDSFEMSILVQAVAAVDPDGGTDVKYSARTAWGIDGSFLSTEKDTGAKM